MNGEISRINAEIREQRKNKVSVRDVSDGYHSFNELYKERVALLSIICNSYPELCWKSRHHFDEEHDPMFNEDFVIGITTPSGIATYHLKLEWWNNFNIIEIPNSPQYDGHTVEDDISKLFSLNKKIIADRTGKSSFTKKI